MQTSSCKFSKSSLKRPPKKERKKPALMLLVQMMVHSILVNCFPLKHAKILVQGPLCDIVCACFNNKKENKV